MLILYVCNNIMYCDMIYVCADNEVRLTIYLIYIVNHTKVDFLNSFNKIRFYNIRQIQN